MMEKRFYVYMLASKRNGTLYLGVTSDIVKRVWQHKNGPAEGFTKKYGIKRLVYYEIHEDAENAMKREKQLKKWRRAWNVELVEEKNSEWRDLFVCRYMSIDWIPAFAGMTLWGRGNDVMGSRE